MKPLILLSILLFSIPKLYAQASIFNGRDLDGWSIYGTEKWFVENGELICESGPDRQYGYLATNTEYGDFELTLEFIQESNGNSGVFFHCSVEGTKVSGWQAEVAPPGKHTGGIYESYGRGWLIQPTGEKERLLKPGNWNEMKIRVQGSRVTTWLNGELMIELEDAAIGSRKGKIALQIHDGGGVRVRWRKLNMKVL